MNLEENKTYKIRWERALKEAGCSYTEICTLLEVKENTFRRAAARGAIKDEYLTLLEEERGISKSYVQDSIEPVLILRNTKVYKSYIDGNDSIPLLEALGNKKLIAYILHKEEEFLKDKDFVMLLTKLKATIELRKIANEH